MRLEKNFISYFGVGVFVTMIDWAGFYALNTILFVDYRIAVSFSFLLGAGFKFFLNKYFTFKNRSKRLLKQSFNYGLMVLTSLLLSIIIMQVLVGFINLDSFLSRVITSFIVLFYGYFFDKNITYA